MSDFNGKRFCDYDGVSALGPDDRLLVSKADGSGKYISMQATYASLSSYVKDRLSRESGFGSMAHQNRYKYALSGHTHNYTDFMYVSDILSGHKIAQIQSKYQNGRIETYPIMRPAMDYAHETYPETGDIRFVYSSYPLNQTLDDINSPDFDGWFLANGLCVQWSMVANETLLKTKDINDFTTDDGLYLHIPLLENFVKMRPDVNDAYDDVVPFKSCVKAHQHVIQYAAASAEVKLNSSGSKIVNNAKCSEFTTGQVHNGKENNSKKAVPMKLSSEMKITTAPVTFALDDYAGGEAVELYPSHVSIPTLVYIYKHRAAGELNVTFIDMDGSILKTERVQAYGDATPPTPQYKAGYCFQRWDGQYTKVTRDSVVKAVYAPDTVTIIFEKGGGGGGTDSVDVVYGQPFPKILVPRMDNADFTGYYTGQNATGTRIYDEQGESGMMMSFSMNTKLYAYFSARTCALTLTAFPSGTGTCTGAGTFSIGAGVTVTASPYSGYQFARWSDFGGQTHNLTITSDTSLTAYFTEKQQELTGGTWTCSISQSIIKATATYQSDGKWTSGDKTWGSFTVKKDGSVFKGVLSINGEGLVYGSTASLTSTSFDMYTSGAVKVGHAVWSA